MKEFIMEIGYRVYRAIGILVKGEDIASMSYRVTENGLKGLVESPMDDTSKMVYGLITIIIVVGLLLLILIPSNSENKK